jgi:hypothetical protein
MAIMTIMHDLTTADAEFNTPREETDFRENGVGIDPEGCGCTDCIVGNSIPYDEDNAKKLAILAYQVKYEGRKFYSRLGDDTNLTPFQHHFDFGFTATWE